jgi:SRSO17 transposase
LSLVHADAVLDRTAPTWLRRLLQWLLLFETAVSRQAQRPALPRYLQGIRSDSRRKSIEAMLARLSDPGS